MRDVHLAITLIGVIVLAIAWDCAKIYRSKNVLAQTTNTQLFSVNNGDTTCRATKIAGSVISISYFCGNPRGATAGSYTAVAGNTTLDSFQIGLNSMVPGTTGSGVNCSFTVNATAMASQGTPANGISFQCATDKRLQGTASFP
jgi:hypothetical protein